MPAPFIRNRGYSDYDVRPDFRVHSIKRAGLKKEAFDFLEHLSSYKADSAIASLNDTAADNVLDALIVGAGFGGVYQLKRLRDEGFKVLLVDSATSYGGIWYWNRYPGARVDSSIPHYEFSDPNLWQEWLWTQRFPGSSELRSYFEFVADKWDLRRDTSFETKVEEARWDDETSMWKIVTSKGPLTARYFLLNTGVAAKRHLPAWPNLERFRGKMIHSSYWPKTGLESADMKGKRIAVVGTGATGVQIAQEVSQLASHFTLFQRTPNLALPMKQFNYTGDGQQFIPKQAYGPLFKNRKDSFAGFDFNFISRATFDDSSETRRETYEQLWAEGDFHFWLATYQDMLFSPAANDEAYAFWREKVRARIHSERNKDILAPLTKPHAFGCKRPSLENGYFEIFDQENVSLVDLSATPVVSVTEHGIRTTEKEWEFDLVILATGFDAVTGGLLDINIEGVNGLRQGDKWVTGVKTYLGMSVHGFPNLFYTYGPQAPASFCNGPSCAELQGEWIVDCMKEMREKGLRRIEAEKEYEDRWVEDIHKMANASLFPTAKSWYMGDNIPGKHRESLMYLGGVPTYYKVLSECARDGYTGFTRS